MNKIANYENFLTQPILIFRGINRFMSAKGTYFFEEYYLRCGVCKKERTVFVRFDDGFDPPKPTDDPDVASLELKFREGHNRTTCYDCFEKLFTENTILVDLSAWGASIICTYEGTL